jgi:hypothetical protein
VKRDFKKRIASSPMVEWSYLREYIRLMSAGSEILGF